VITLPELIKQAVENRVSQVHTSIPGRVESYDASKRKASIKPLVKRRYRDGRVDDMPVVVNVPVVFPEGGGARITFPVSRGDTGLLVFAERSIDVWLSRGGDVDPNDFRKHDISDGVFIPGLHPFNSAPSADASSVVIEFGGAKIKIQPDEKLAIGTSAAELLDLFEQTLTGLEQATVSTALGPQPLINAATFTAIKTLLAQIKGTL
jgi:hypothetical protein